MTDAVEAHILIVDEDDQVRTLLQKYLARNGFWVTGANSVGRCERLLGGLEFDLILIDTSIGDGAGETLMQTLLDRGGTPLVALTASDRGRALAKAAGASADLGKPFDPTALLTTVNAVLNRKPPEKKPVEPPRRLKLGAIQYDVDRGELWRGDERVRLTATEIQLMRIFSGAVGTAISRAQLVEDLGRGQGQAQERAVDVQITRLRRKLEENPKSPRYLQTVRGAGYMLAVD